MSEHDEQAALVEWAAYSVGAYPALALLYAIPNAGVGRNKRLQAEGAKAGVPDLHLPVARASYHGLWIEMKYKKGQPSSAQKAWITALQDEGHKVAVCYSAEAAMVEIITYLKG